MAERDAELIRELWAAVAQGDVDVAVEALDPGVRWHGAGDPEGGCRNRDEAHDFIRQALADGISAQGLDSKITEIIVFPTVDDPVAEAGGQPSAG